MNAQSDAAERRALRLSWIGLCLALALHVADEALNDFLSVYNQQVARMREALPWLPVPRFSFVPWLVGLCLAIVVLLALTPWVVRQGRGARIFTGVFALLMTLQAAGHIVMSSWQRWWMPGATSAPVLIVAAGFVLSFVLGPAGAGPERPAAMNLPPS